MPVPNATIAAGTPNAARMTRAKNQEMNDNFSLSADANAHRTPGYYVCVWNVSNRDIKIDRPWAHPAVVLKAAPQGAEYGPPFVIEDIKQEAVDRPGSWEMGTRGVRGEFLAQDLLNPDRMWMPGNPEPYWKSEAPMNAANMGNQGTNQYTFGCFWEVKKNPQEPPSPEGVKRARERMEATYNQLIEDARILARSGHDGAKELSRNKIMHFAAEYFDIDEDWHRVMRGKKQCPGCGEMVAVIIKRHMPKDKCGYVFDAQGALDGGLLSMKEAVELGLMEAPVKK